MNRTYSLTVLICAVSILGTPGCREPKAHPRSTSEAEDTRIGHPPVPSGARARVLYLIVDYDGVYFGDQRLDCRFAIEVIREFAAREGIRSVAIFPTDGAKYGDVVKVFAEVKAAKLIHNSLETLSRSPGYRLPQIGTFKKVGCHWIDEENHEHFL